MIDLYASVSPNVIKVYIALEEMGLEYRTRVVHLMKNENFAPEFVALNPMAKVPVIVDHAPVSGGPFAVFESGAILMYLTEKTGKFLSTDPIRRSEAIQWVTMQVANVGPAMGQYVHFTRYALQDKGEYAPARFATISRNILDVIERRLDSRPYIGGEEYSIADMAMLPWMQFLDFILGDGTTQHYPRIAAWAAKLGERPAVQRTGEIIADLGAQLTPPDKATPDAQDRFFGRGKYNRIE